MAHPQPDHLRTLVLDYLCHSCYTKTAQAFSKESAVRHLGQGRERNLFRVRAVGANLRIERRSDTEHHSARMHTDAYFIWEG
ncbi:hypothetical protein EDD16DRAFT_673900 [Pisolithus croceorrhizus]|nr:hypothetical protein EDD16DRAFT_673900 [Pisolithus croceorrhizus]